MDDSILLRYRVDLGQIEAVATPGLGGRLGSSDCMCAAAGTLFAFTKTKVYKLRDGDGKSMVQFAELPSQVQVKGAFSATCVVNGVIYAAPAKATKMLSLDVQNGETKLINVGGGVHSRGECANFSSICTADGKIYLAPAYAARMVVYDIKNRTIREVDVSSAGLETGKPKFRAICPAGGKIYLAPDHAEKMFVYDPTINAGVGVELPESCSGTKYGDMCAVGGKARLTFKTVGTMRYTLSFRPQNKALLCKGSGVKTLPNLRFSFHSPSHPCSWQQVYLAPHGTCSVLECTDHQALSKTSSAKAILAEYEAEKATPMDSWLYCNRN